MIKMNMVIFIVALSVVLKFNEANANETKICEYINEEYSGGFYFNKWRASKINVGFFGLNREKNLLQEKLKKFEKITNVKVNLLKGFGDLTLIQVESLEEFFDAYGDTIIKNRYVGNYLEFIEISKSIKGSLSYFITPKENDLYQAVAIFEHSGVQSDNVKNISRFVESLLFPSKLIRGSKTKKKFIISDSSYDRLAKWIYSEEYSENKFLEETQKHFNCE